MAYSMTYDSLVNDVIAYCERSDDPFLSQVPRFIYLAEQRIASEVHGLGLTRTVTGNMVTGQGVITKPARWRETSSINFGTGQASNTRNFIYKRSYEYCRAFWPDSSQSGVPRYYSDYDYNHMLIVPTPAADYPFEMMYHELPDPLSESVQTNWTTENAPQLLLYASLLETAPFLKNDERLGVWKGLYDSAKQSIETEDARRWGDRSSSPR